MYSADRTTVNRDCTYEEEASLLLFVSVLYQLSLIFGLLFDSFSRLQIDRKWEAERGNDTQDSAVRCGTRTGAACGPRTAASLTTGPRTGPVVKSNSDHEPRSSVKKQLGSSLFVCLIRWKNQNSSIQKSKTSFYKVDV